MPPRLNAAAKRIKTLMQGAGIARPEGKTCYSHLKYLEDGVLVLASKNGAAFFRRAEELPRFMEYVKDYQEKNEAIAYLYMLPSGNKKKIVSLGPILAGNILKEMEKEDEA